MGHRSPLDILLILILVLAACAPADLDITPTPVPTPVPLITVYVTGAVAEPGMTIELAQGSRVSDAIEAAGGALEDADLERVNLAALLRDGEQVHVPALGEAVDVEEVVESEPEVVVSGPQAQLDHLITSLPGLFNAGVIRWRRDTSVEPLIVEREGGVTGRISFNEAGGGLMELTLGAFESPEAALAYYTSVRENLLTLDRAQERDIFPTPNAFGGGTYGSDAIFVRDNIFIRVSVPRFSSTAGDPLIPMGREVFNFLDSALAAEGEEE